MLLTPFQLALWTLVKPYYKAAEPKRYYHTMTHIDAMIQGYGKYFGEIPKSEYLAIVYHDIVYDPLSKTNEVDSAALLWEHYLGHFSHLDPLVTERAVKIVLATQHKPGELVDPIAYRVVDLDLMILGLEPEVYDEYVKNTRKEYLMFNDAQWKYGRSKVLKMFLEYERLFHTDELHNALDKQARDNLQRELASL